MVAEWLQRLLILQDRDAKCDTIERQLGDIPHEIKKEEAAIERLQATLKEEEVRIRDLEVRRKDLEGEVGQAEEQIVKYKTQQMQVKKNEEYTALEHEIKTLQDKISELEDTELQLMEEIESGETALAETRASTKSQCQTLESHIERLRANYDSFASELDDARQSVKECAAEIAPDVLQQYQYVKTQVKRPPLVVPIEDGKCQGCHLKVSGEVDSSARKGAELVRCDNCGRILYFDR